MNYEGKGFNKGKIPRPCIICGSSIQFLPTLSAPKGAWIDAETGDHHRCYRHSPEALHFKSIMSEV